MTNRIDLRRSKAAAGLIVVLASVSVFIGLFSLLSGRPGGLCFVLCGVPVFIAGILGILDGKPRVTLTDIGLTVRAIGRYEIPWQEIRSARIESLPRAGDLIILELKNGRRHRFAGDFLEITSRRLLSMIEAHLGNQS